MVCCNSVSVQLMTFLVGCQVFMEREAELRVRSKPVNITCFKTSIWDETLYKVIILDFRQVFAFEVYVLLSAQHEQSFMKNKVHSSV